MSNSRRRRRRRSRDGGSPDVDPYELFMDTLCNTLGTIMFVMLCIVIFSKVPDGTEPIDPTVTPEEIETVEAQTKQLEAKLASLVAALSALPPAGDPAVIKRWKEVLAELELMHAKKVAEITAEAQARARLHANTVALQSLEERKAQLEARLAELEKIRKESNAAVQLVRTPRFRADPRKAVLLLCSSGRVSVATVAAGTREIPEPATGGIPVFDEASAKLVISQLFANKPASQWRAEVAVWPSGFPAYKLLESVMVDSKFGVNPLPVPAGEPIREGAGGVQ